MELGARLAALARVLDEGAHLWRPRPFVGEPAWVRTHPAIAAWCSGLSADGVVAIERDDRLPADAPAELKAWEARVADLLAAPRSEAYVAAGLARPNAVPARKSDQVAGFAGALPDVPAARSILDWCGGKGHLGRTLAGRLGLPVTVLDREPRYAEEARRLAERERVGLTFVAADALAGHADRFGPGVLAIGLHACGELGTRLLEHAVDRGAAMVGLAPCCLHKVPGVLEAGYTPLSIAGRAHDPRLDHASLRLATADEVVARTSLRATRQRENAFRLGFDHLARAAGRTSYTPLGTLPAELWRRDFAAFAIAVAALRSVELPAKWDPVEAEAFGWARAAEVRSQGLVRGIFKRAIEVWCALDRAAFLEEHGFAVEVSTFAARAVTPRNLVIIAVPQD